MGNKRFIEGDNLSDAWSKAFSLAYKSSTPLYNLTVGFPVFGEQGEMFIENEARNIREAIDIELHKVNKATTETVASTIFPISLWNPALSSEHLYTRYNTIWSRVRRHQSNRYGTYFQRMIAYGWEEVTGGSNYEVKSDDKKRDNLLLPGTVNQLEHVIHTFMNGNHRRSALFVSVTNPKIDHSNQPQRGFPCLQHVHFVPGQQNTLTITGIYSTQLLFEKAYGNYLGLYRLGKFMAANMGLRLIRVECNASWVKPFEASNTNKADLQNLIEVLNTMEVI